MRHADAELAGQQLVEEEPLGARQPEPPRGHHRALRGGVGLLQRQQPLLDPRRERQIRLRRARRHGVERQRDELGEIAGRGVALAEQPVRDAASLPAPTARSPADGTTRFSRRPVRKNIAHAASAGGASRKYAASAATFAFVEVVRSSAS